MPTPSHPPLFDDLNYVWWGVKPMKLSHYAVFSSLLLLLPSQTQMSSAPYSEAPLVYIPSLTSRIKFHTTVYRIVVLCVLMPM
jgi:hypothetical protein